MNKICIRSIVTDILNPIVWNIPGNKAAKLYRFSLAEYSSVLDLGLAAKLTQSDRRAAQYLAHLQDELKHTNIFSNQANKINAAQGRKIYPFPNADYEYLFSKLGEKQFLAFVHLGEKKGCIQFSSYAKYFAQKGDDYTSSMFKAVLADEQQHMSYTYDLLLELCGGKKALKKELSKARLWESSRNWMRSGRAITSKLFIVITFSVYPLFLPYKLLALLRVKSTKQTGWN